MIYIFGVFLAVIAIAFFVRLVRKKASTLPYHARGSLLTKAELNFYQQIAPVVESLGLKLQMKVRLWDIVDVNPNTEQSFSYQNKISSKHIDFVLVDTTMRIVGCIELDDASHQTASAKENDAFKDAVLRAAKIPLIRVKATKRYDAAHIEQQISTM